MKPMQDEENANLEEHALCLRFCYLPKGTPSLWVNLTLIIDKHKATSCNATKIKQLLLEIIVWVSGVRCQVFVHGIVVW